MTSNSLTAIPIRLTGSPFRSDRGRGERRAAPELGVDNDVLGDLARRSPTATAPVAGVGPRQPLAGIRIVDFTWAIAGSFATRLLADLGADVVKIESENRLDPVRHIGPQPSDKVSLDTNGVFQDCGAGKRAVTINIGTPEGQELVRKLVRTADVVTSNYTPDRLDRWGFDRKALAALRPGLIVANLAVMGLSGPDAGWRSYGNGLVAMSGVAAHTGFEGRVPQCLGTMHTDFTVPYFAAMHILAALHHRDRTGEGAYLELSQYESSVRLMDVELARVLNGGEGPGRIANRSDYCSPHGIFPAAGNDRWVAVACRDNAERERLAEVIGADPSDENVAAWTSSRRLARRSCGPFGSPACRSARWKTSATTTRIPSPGRYGPPCRCRRGSRLRSSKPRACGMGSGSRCAGRHSGWNTPTRCSTGELGVDPARFVELVDAQVLW